MLIGRCSGLCVFVCPPASCSDERRQIEKKVLPEFYKGIRTHKKTFEIRKDEDNTQPGDILALREWDGEKYTGGKTRREVTRVLRNAPEYGLMEGYCILSLQVPGWNRFKASACLDGEPSAPFSRSGSKEHKAAGRALLDCKLKTETLNKA